MRLQRGLRFCFEGFYWRLHCRVYQFRMSLTKEPTCHLSCGIEDVNGEKRGSGEGEAVKGGNGEG